MAEEVEKEVEATTPNEGESDNDEEGIVDEEEEESEVLVVEGVPLDTSYMTINEAYSIYPEDTVIEAMKKELSNMIEREVIGLV